MYPFFIRKSSLRFISLFLNGPVKTAIASSVSSKSKPKFLILFVSSLYSLIENHLHNKKDSNSTLI